MNWCYQKQPYAIWDGDNLADFEELLASNLENENFGLSVVGSDLHINRFGQQLILTPGMVALGGWPNVATGPEFEAGYNPVP